MTTAILITIIIGQSIFMVHFARRLLSVNASAKEGWASAAFWQQQDGEHVEMLRERGLL